MERNQGKRQNISISTEAIANNIDLLTKILLGLQVKPLVRFKCVSKQWLSLISDPQFCLSYNRHHHTRYPTPSALVLDSFSYTHEFEIVSLNNKTIPKVLFFDYLNATNRIQQSCNGLLLCLSFDKTVKLGEDIYYICNPATNQFKRLPTCERFGWVNLAFDPLKSSHYKVICVGRAKKKGRYQINMYSSETDSWRPLEITFTWPQGIDFSSAVFCNGAVHWYSKDETSLYFDVDRECLNTMPMPNLAQHPDYQTVHYFGESYGRLHLIMTEEMLPPLQFDLLEMSADYSGWFVRYHVDLDVVSVAFPDTIWYDDGDCSFSVLHVIRAQKEEEATVVVLAADDKAFSYNVHDGTSKKLCDLEDGLNQNLSETFQYFEILTSV